MSSSTQVDDFLNTVSKFSRERNEEEQRRQRELERDVDELRKKHGLSKKPSGPSNFSRQTESKYSSNSARRSKADIPQELSDDSDDSEYAPPLPNRFRDSERAPPLPSRRDPVGPRLPKRKSEVSSPISNEFLVELVTPVTRKDPKPVPPKPIKLLQESGPVKSDTKSSPMKFLSFTEMEQNIKGGQSIRNVPVHSSSKPTDQSNKPNSIRDDSLPIKELKRRPLIPAKPKPKISNNKDEIFLNHSISKLKSVPPKPKEKVSVENMSMNQKDIQIKLKKNNSQPIAKSNGVISLNNNSWKKENGEPVPEGISALGRLKPVKPRPIVAKKNQEATKISNMTMNKDTKAISHTVEAPVDFKEQLASIVRIRTTPLTSSNSVIFNGLARSKTEPICSEPQSESTDIISHPNRTRTKGPKRRLPKNIANASSSTEKNSIEKSSASDKIGEFKRGKVPPPVDKHSKERALKNLKPRSVSGELFI